MKLKVTEREGVTLIMIDGHVALGQNEELMREKIRQQLEAGKTRIVLDLGRVSFMDSEGLSELLRANVTAGRHGAVIKLANLTKKLDKLMDVTKLSLIFERYRSVEEAVRSFSAGKSG